MVYCDWTGEQPSILCLSLPPRPGSPWQPPTTLNVSLYGWYGLNNSTGSVKTSSDAIRNNAHISPSAAPFRSSLRCLERLRDASPCLSGSGVGRAAQARNKNKSINPQGRPLRRRLAALALVERKERVVLLGEDPHLLLCEFIFPPCCADDSLVFDIELKHNNLVIALQIQGLVDVLDPLNHF